MIYALPSVDIQASDAPDKVCQALSDFGAFFLRGGKTSEFMCLEKLVALAKCFFHDTPADVKARLHHGFDEGYLLPGELLYEGQRDLWICLKITSRCPFIHSSELNEVRWNDPSTMLRVNGNREVISGQTLCEQLAMSPDQSKSQLLWPSSLLSNGLKEKLYNFVLLCEKDCQSLYSILEQALDLPEKFFVNRHQSDSSKLFRLMRYPESDADEHDEVRKPAHTDFGTFTLLFLLDSVDGLQVKLPSGDWSDVLQSEPRVLVIGGGILEQWTNGRFKALVHRVVREAKENQCRERLSAAYFVDPDKNVTINSQDLFPGERPIHEPATAGECLERRLKSIKVRQQAF